MQGLVDAEDEREADERVVGQGGRARPPVVERRAARPAEERALGLDVEPPRLRDLRKNVRSAGADSRRRSSGVERRDGGVIRGSGTRAVRAMGPVSTSGRQCPDVDVRTPSVDRAPRATLRPPCGGNAPMKFGLFYEHQLPRPWDEDAEHALLQNALEQCELADRSASTTCWEVEHHFLEEYSHSSAPEVFLAAGRSARSTSGSGTASCRRRRASTTRRASPSASRRSTSSRTAASSSAPASRRRRRSSAASCSTPRRSGRCGRRARASRSAA